MDVPIEQVSLELLGELYLLPDEVPLPVDIGNVVGVLPKDVSTSHPNQATKDISRALGTVFLSTQSRCLSSFRVSMVQTAPRVLPSAVAFPGSFQFPARRCLAPEPFSRTYQLPLPLRQSSPVGVSKTVPGFRHPMTSTLSYAANAASAVPYDTEDVDQVISRVSPIFGSDTSPLFQMGMVVWPKQRYGAQRDPTVHLSAGGRTNGMLKEKRIWHSHLAVMPGHGLLSGVRQCVGGSSTQPKNSGSDKCNGQQQDRRQGNKRRRASEDDEEPEPKSQKGSDNGSNGKARAVDDDDHYMCPYYLKDPKRHAACCKKKWRAGDLRKLKEHIEKKHLRWVCNYCNQAFVDRPSMERHTHLDNGQRDYVDGLNHDQKDELRDKRKFWGKNDKEYWDIICKIIFCDDQPLPAHREFTWEEVQDLHELNNKLQQRLQRVLDRLRDMQGGGWITPDEVSSLIDIIEEHSPSISTGDVSAPAQQPSAEPDCMNQIDNVLPLTQGGVAELLTGDSTHPEMDSNTDDIDLLADSEAQAQPLQAQQGSSSGAETRSDWWNSLTQLQPREGPSTVSMIETVHSSSLSFQSSSNLNNRNHDQGENSTVGTVPVSPSLCLLSDVEADNGALSQIGMGFGAE